MMPNPQDDLLDRARKTIRDLRDKLAAAEAQSRQEPIAVIGMAFRFPGAGTDATKLWQMIVEGRDAVRPVPADRWDRDAFFDAGNATPGKIVTRHAAVLDDVRRFDAAFFDIMPREAVQMDPQQRIFLETAWHALEDAGLPRDQLAGTEAGVFVGVHNHSSDYKTMQFRNLDSLDAWSMTGTAHDIIAGRLSYWLDLGGPALAVNTACSSSLAAIHLACRSLRANDCSIALAGGVNMVLEPGPTVAESQLELLSPDGHCRTFDSRAAGMGRGEGCGVAVLKKLSEALRDGDRVLAVIRGSSMNQDGHTNGLTAPNGLAQQRLLRRALKDARVDAAQIGYVETHGTGTALGDPIEVEALAEVLGGAGRTSPCVLGGVKANLGHLEGAAGIAGVIKAVMVLRHQWIPPVANLEKLNPHFSLEGTNVEIPREGRPWRTDQARLAGVSSFGYSGTNVHVVLEEAPAEPAARASGGPFFVLVSARTTSALKHLATAYAERLEAAEADELRDIAYTSAMRRTHHAHRIAVHGTGTASVARDLRQRAQDLAKPLANGAHRFDEKLRLWEAGDAVDFREFFPDGGRVVDLPLYPFEGRDYWLSETADAGLNARIPVAAQMPSHMSAERLRNDWLYAVEWIRKDFEPSKAAKSVSPATWLLLGEKSELTRRLGEVIRAHGDEVVSALEEASNTGPAQYVVYAVQEQNAAKATADALFATRAVLASGFPVRLWFLTESTGPIGETASAAHAAVHAFSRVAGLEHPELISGVLDADPESFDAVYEQLKHSAGEDLLALRCGICWVPRLRRETLAQPAPFSVKPDRSYLITGAFGSIGMEIAAWLVALGARHLVLLGRRDPVESGKPEIIERIAAWRAEGVDVSAKSCDVADEPQVCAMLVGITKTYAPLAGVIHAAAAMHFSPLEDISHQELIASFHAKVEGAEVLDRCTRGYDLDFFVLFSSASATIGLRNGAAYAAANAALAAVASQRRAYGAPALCVEWGSWGSSASKPQLELIAKSGFSAMHPDAAFAMLGASIATGRKHCMIADIDWQVLEPALEMRGRQALIADVASTNKPQSASQDSADRTAWLAELEKLTSSERLHKILDFVAAQTRLVFGMPHDEPVDEGRGLFAMGMDSLMNVELKRKLEQGTGLSLSGTLTLTYPSIAELAGYLNSVLFKSTAEVVEPNTGLPGGELDLESLAEMDDAEISAALAAELAAVQEKFGAIEI